MNPAQSLYDYLSAVKAAIAAGTNQQGPARELDTESGMLLQLQAIADLEGVRRGIDDLESKGLPVVVYRDYLRGWTSMLLAYPHGWRTAVAAEEVLATPTLDHLRTLAGWFETVRTQPGKESQKELRSFLDEVQRLLESDDSISGELRVYLGRLINEMRNALDDEKIFQRFDFNEAGQRLWTALYAAAAQTQDEEKKSMWTDLASKLWWPTAAGVLGSAPSIIAGVLSAAGSR